MSDTAKKLTVILTVCALSDRGHYITKVFRLGQDHEIDLQLELCAYEEDGDVRISFDPPPEPPEDDPTRVVTIGLSDTLVLKSRLLFPPILPENPTAKQRWKYLVDVLKQKG